jgi:hypothetical protein
MTWSDFYLICFAVGFLLSAVSFLVGGLHGHVHLPHFPDFRRSRRYWTRPRRTRRRACAWRGIREATAGGESPVSPFNFVTVTAFLAWFGGTGFLITRFSSYLVSRSDC